jgi:hypothetical protein
VNELAERARGVKACVPAQPSLACAFDCKWPDKCCSHGNHTPRVQGSARPSDCTPTSFCADLNAGRPCACFPAQQLQEGFMQAFYEMAAMLGIEGAQAKSPEQVYREQVKPALEALKQRAANAEEAYLNMRAWAEQNGLDTATHDSGVPEGANRG